jgi:hypothetical protein
MASSASQKDQAHELIDRLAPSQVSAIVSVLQAMLDPVAKAIVSAPFDDEVESAEEKAAVARSKEWFQKQAGFTNDQVMADLGIDRKDLKPKA